MAAKSFTTTELVEQMLLQLPMKDLLLAQRVDKIFKATIDGSLKLQQALFFTLPPQPRQHQPSRQHHTHQLTPLQIVDPGHTQRLHRLPHAQLPQRPFTAAPRLGAYSSRNHPRNSIFVPKTRCERHSHVRCGSAPIRTASTQCANVLPSSSIGANA